LLKKFKKKIAKNFKNKKNILKKIEKKRRKKIFKK